MKIFVLYLLLNLFQWITNICVCGCDCGECLTECCIEGVDISMHGIYLYIFNFYRYFEGGVSSVYLWDLDHGFAGVILIKKAGDGSKKIKGCWDSIHVVEVQVSKEHCQSNQN